MKICSICKEQKEFSEFNKNSSKKDGLQTMCRLCWRSYYKENYYLRGKEKERLLQKNKKNRERLKQIIRDAKNVPCYDCKVKYPPYVMDFDHMYDKNFTISSATTGKFSIEKILEEIAKCQVVCANCHRERTHGKNNHSQVALSAGAT